MHNCAQLSDVFNTDRNCLFHTQHQLPSHLTAHLHNLLIIRLSKDVREGNINIYVKVKINHFLCSLFTCQVRHIIVKGYRGDQAWFFLHIQKLIAPSHFLVFSPFGSGILENLLYQPLLDGEESGQPIISWAFLLALLEIGMISTFLQSSGTSPSQHDFSEVIENGLPVTSFTSLRTSLMGESHQIPQTCVLSNLYHSLTR